MNNQIVEAQGCADVREFLARYNKTDRYTERGAEYAQALLDSHETDFARDGFDVISHFYSITGQTMYFGKCPPWVQEKKIQAD